MFDLWIEAAEESYADVALSDQFREVYGGFANAHMRLRAALQQEVEQVSERFGMPTRSEMDAAHRRIAELERAVRRMLRGAQAKPAAASAPKPDAGPAPVAAASAPPRAAAQPTTPPEAAPAKRATRQTAAAPETSRPKASNTRPAAKKATKTSKSPARAPSGGKP